MERIITKQKRGYLEVRRNVGPVMVTLKCCLSDRSGRSDSGAEAYWAFLLNQFRVSTSRQAMRPAPCKLCCMPYPPDFLCYIIIVYFRQFSIILAYNPMGIATIPSSRAYCSVPG